MARYVLLTIALLAFCAAAMAQMWPPGGGAVQGSVGLVPLTAGTASLFCPHHGSVASWYAPPHCLSGASAMHEAAPRLGLV